MYTDCSGRACTRVHSLCDSSKEVCINSDYFRETTTSEMTKGMLFTYPECTCEHCMNESGTSNRTACDVSILV